MQEILNQISQNELYMQQRKILGSKMTDQHKGRITTTGNVIDALPARARVELENHTVPPRSYGGRMPLIMLGYALPEAPLVLMEDHPYEAEVEIIAAIARKTGVPSPELLYVGELPYTTSAVLRQLPPAEDGYFIHPFMGTKNLQLPGRSLPDSSMFNDKVFMRQQMQSNGLRNNVIPGTEIVVDKNDSEEDLMQKVDHGIVGSPYQMQRVKLGNTASGLCTIVLDQELYAKHPEYKNRVDSSVREFFHTNGTSSLGNIVIEAELDPEDGWVDYGTRGYLLPNGELVMTSFARQVTSESGVYMGAFVTSTLNPEVIGLNSVQSSNLVYVTEGYAKPIHGLGYNGDVNLDIFTNINNENLALAHDPNMRKGGTSADSAVLSLKDSMAVSDLDLTLTTNTPLDEDQVNRMIVDAWENHGVVIYSSTFLRYPKISSGEASYTVKAISELENPVINENYVEKEIANVIETMDSLGVGKFSFNRKDKHE